MTLLYDLFYVFALALGWPWLLWRRLRRGPGSLSFRERLGNVPSRPVAAQCVWLHGVSLGEINATRTLVAELRRRAPETVVVVSSTTATGLTRARELYPNLAVFRFPLDLSPVLTRVFDRVRPSTIVLLELEVWPNLIEVARRRGVPVVIANGRVTAGRTLRAFGWPVLRQVAARMMRGVRWIGAQDETYAARFMQLGALPERVEVVGSLKYDAADLADAVAGQEQLAADLGLSDCEPLWVAGSTGPGEEAILLEAYARLLERRPDLRLAIIPRRPERFDEVAQIVASAGFTCVRRSGRPAPAPLVEAARRLAPPHAAQLDAPASGVDSRPAVLLGDTMGELRKFYGLATIVFVGRSLVPMGGSDVMEVAGLAKPALVGPHTENFAEAVALLRGAGGCRVVADGDALRVAAAELLSDESARARMGVAAREVIASRRGATERTVDRILELADRS